jgi:phytoene desaturase
MSTVVVGAGIGGLSIAALLAKKGRRVLVIEKNGSPGGRARVYREAGYSFDMGPSWYLMPDVFEDFFRELGEEPGDLYTLRRIDPSYRIFFQDRTVTDISADVDGNLELFDGLESGGGKKLKRYLERAEEHYRIAKKDLLYRDYSRLLNLVDGRLLLDGLRLPLFGNIDDFIGDIFISDKARRILEYSIGFVGGSPKNTPALYYIMNHVDFNLGVWYPEGGIWKVIEGLYEICLRYNVEFRFDEPVKGIDVEDGEARAVVTERGRYPSETVIVNADYAHTELELLEGSYRSYNSGYWESRVFAPSALVIYIGLDKRLPGLLHHNLYLAGNWSLGFDVLYDPEVPGWPDGVSYYVNVTSVTDVTVAPEGGETLFILIPLPFEVEDTDKAREDWYQRIVGHLEGLVGEPILGHEVVKRMFGPREFISEYNAFKGTSLGLVHTLRQSAIFRPGHRSRKVQNLYYTGHYTHPGIGLPLVLISSQILASRLE